MSLKKFRFLMNFLLYGLSRSQAVDGQSISRYEIILFYVHVWHRNILSLTIFVAKTIKKTPVCLYFLTSVNITNSNPSHGLQVICETLINHPLGNPGTVILNPGGTQAHFRVPSSPPAIVRTCAWARFKYRGQPDQAPSPEKLCVRLALDIVIGPWRLQPAHVGTTSQRV